MGCYPHALSNELLEDLRTQLPSSCLYGGQTRWPDMSVRQMRCASLLVNLLKKFGGTSLEADEAAIRKFLAVNDRCGTWELGTISSWDEELLGTLKTVLANFFYPEGDPLIQGFNQILSLARPGPGASRGSRGEDFYTKLFDGPLTGTKQFLYDTYAAYFSDDPTWFAAEEARYRVYGPMEYVVSSKLLPVPKNREISRIIFVEPSLNTFFQLGLGAILESRLRSFFQLDLATQQEFNRELARRGSIDGSLVTLDLSSASDSLSLRMLRSVLPESVLSWFKLLRCSSAVLPCGNTVELEMLSTMGNGYTFPLQTALFSAVLVSAYRCRGIPMRLNRNNEPGNFGVFGDDLIYVREVHSDVIRLLTLLGFEVNADKSFSNEYDRFRESCGADWFFGADVRPVFIKSLDSLQDYYTAINLLVRWSANSGVPLSRTIRWLTSRARRLEASSRKAGARLTYVPVWEAMDAGIRCPLSVMMGDQRRDKNASFIYYAWESRPRLLRVIDSGIVAPRGMRERRYNPDGLMLMALAGVWNGSSGISVPSRTATYHRTRHIAPNWDACEKAPSVAYLGYASLRSFTNSFAINVL